MIIKKNANRKLKLKIIYRKIIKNCSNIAIIAKIAKYKKIVIREKTIEIDISIELSIVNILIEIFNNNKIVKIETIVFEKLN